jgi:hypothetical protein
MKKIKVRHSEIVRFILDVLLLLTYAAGVVLLVWIMFRIRWDISNDMWPPISTLANWAQVIIAYAAVFAVFQYASSYAEIADRKTKTVLESVTFFREQVLESADNILLFTKKNKIEFPTILLRKNTPPLLFTEDEFFERVSPNQKDEVEKYAKLIADKPDFEKSIRSCLNAAEEFAIGVLNTTSQDHIATSSIRKPFVQIVEQLAIPLYYQIGVAEDRFSYLTVSFCKPGPDRDGCI